MARTYYPMAVRFADATHKRLTRYQAKLSAGRTAGQITALINLITCLGEFLIAWPKETPDD